MNLYDSDIQRTKNRIEKYYKNCETILWQRQRLDKLTVRLQNIKDDINNPNLNFSLHTGVKGVNYDGIIVDGGLPVSSNMERDIEQIYSKLENEMAETEKEIVQTKILIRRLESKNETIDHCIRMLSEENRKILHKRFQEKKSLVKISYESNMSKTTTSRLLHDIYGDLSELLCVLENVDQKRTKNGPKADQKRDKVGNLRQ